MGDFPGDIRPGLQCDGWVALRVRGEGVTREETSMSAVTREEMSERASEGRAGEARSPVAIASGCALRGRPGARGCRGDARSHRCPRRRRWVTRSACYMYTWQWPGSRWPGSWGSPVRECSTCFGVIWPGTAGWQAAAEVGWVCSCLTLATGSLWRHEAWGNLVDVGPAAGVVVRAVVVLRGLPNGPFGD